MTLPEPIELSGLVVQIYVHLVPVDHLAASLLPPLLPVVLQLLGVAGLIHCCVV